jgi:DNA (cytosine-5)-methyltransferase 1
MAFSPTKKIKAADLFCGAGGTSTGLLMAANKLKADLELVAVNHWQIAIDTHSVNHPYAQHACTGIDSVDPRRLVPGGHLDILCASPECTHHSNARGGRPMSDQSRSSAWHILRFCEALYVANVVIENVPEFMSWGPLGKNGRPLKSKRGELFQQFISSLRSLGYRVEYKVLNCADFGDPTSRKRLFIIARRGNKKISWPSPTHAPMAELEKPSLFADDRKPWRSAREIIDWSIPSQSIFGRKKPLADKTIQRIQAGIKKYWGLEIDLARCLRDDLKPFLVVMRNNADARSLDEPLPTLTAGGTHLGIVEAFIVPQFGERKGQKPRTHRIDEPTPAVTSHGAGALVEGFLLGQQSGATARSVRDAVPTIATAGAISLTQPVMVPVRGPSTLASSSSSSLAAASLVELSVHPRPFIVEYYGTQNMSDMDSPLPTVTGNDRFALVEAWQVDRYMLDIRFRMLQAKELAAAQGFPPEYQFRGTKKDVVKLIGNAVPARTAQALVLQCFDMDADTQRAA